MFSKSDTTVDKAGCKSDRTVAYEMIVAEQVARPGIVTFELLHHSSSGFFFQKGTMQLDEAISQLALSTGRSAWRRPNAPFPPAELLAMTLRRLALEAANQRALRRRQIAAAPIIPGPHQIWQNLVFTLQIVQ